MQLDKWQEQVLKHNGNMLLCTGRQVGKTTIFSRKACEYMINKPNVKIIVVSLTEDQAHLIIIMMLNFLEKYHKHLIKKPRSKNVTKNKIVLINGSQVLSRPVGQTGDAVRGFTGDVLIIDEASRMPESVFISAKPTLLTTGGQLWLCSTPFKKKIKGVETYFYQSFLNKNKRFEVFHISSEEVIKNRAITDSWTAKQRIGALQMLDDEKKDMGEKAYAQEYLGIFQDDLNSFFSDELIKKVCTERRKPRNEYFNYYLGLDIARMGGDLSTFEIIEKHDNFLIQVENIYKKKTLTTQTYDKIMELHKQWDFKLVGIDAGSGSLGVGLLDFLLREPIIAKRMIALNNRTVVLDKWGTHTRGLLKEDMYQTLLALMEQGRIKLLNDDTMIRALQSIQIEYIMKEGEKTKVKIYGAEDHIVEGLIRAVHLAHEKSLNSTLTYC